jgi:hypothetical protein
MASALSSPLLGTGPKSRHTGSALAEPPPRTPPTPSSERTPATAGAPRQWGQRPDAGASRRICFSRPSPTTKMGVPGSCFSRPSPTTKMGAPGGCFSRPLATTKLGAPGQLLFAPFTHHETGCPRAVAFRALHPPRNWVPPVPRRWGPGIARTQPKRPSIQGMSGAPTQWVARSLTSPGPPGGGRASPASLSPPQGESASISLNPSQIFRQ